MNLKLICCEVFMRPVCLAAAHSPHTIDLEFTRMNSHVSPEAMRKQIQEKIDAAGSGYDAILLGFGLCGNSTVGLKAETIPLVIPRAHDCCTIFLGSRDRFLEYFGDNFSAEWSTDGYMERGGEDYLRETEVGRLLGLDGGYAGLVEKYGEENAKFIWETLHPGMESRELTFITISEVSDRKYLDAFKSYARDKGRQLRIIDGSLRILENLINGKWDEEDFLTVPPGKAISAVYDHKTVMSTEL